MTFTQLHTSGSRNLKKKPTKGRVLRFEPLQSRELLAGDLPFGPQPLPKPGRAAEITFHGTQAAGGAATVVVNGGQAALKNGGQATEVVNGGQAAAKTGERATEIVNGGQDALRAAQAGPWDHLPKLIHTEEWQAAFGEHQAAVAAKDTQKQIETSRQMRALEVWEYPDGTRTMVQSGQPYIPAGQVDDVIEGVVDTAKAGKGVLGKTIGVLGGVADFVVDPALGYLFYDDNLATGEKVFGKNSYCSEAYANLQCVPALGGPVADVTACITTIFRTDWGTYLFGPDEGPTRNEMQAAIDRYRDLENRKDYDANHGNQYQEQLWQEVLKAKEVLQGYNIDPAKVR